MILLAFSMPFFTPPQTITTVMMRKTSVPMIGPQTWLTKPPKKPQKKGKAEGRKRVKRVNFGDIGDDEDWFKMKSESGTGAEVDSLDDVPSEYRGLVRDYFNALNNGGKKK